MHETHFVIFGATHWLIFGLMACATIACVLAARRGFIRTVDYSLALILIASKLTTFLLAWRDGNLSWQNALPMHLCDWAAFCVIITLVWRRQWIYEIAYFWGLAGTLQAVLTPDLSFAFPNPRFITFFVSHCGLIVAVLYLTLGAKMRPSRFSVLKVFGFTQIYLLVTFGVNKLFSANYGYLCAKPQHHSLMDYLGPWPFYILSMEILALILFALLYSPFWIGNRLSKRTPSPA
ncbi:MAG: TIGR02206 family membrane protein [bacterium]